MPCALLEFPNELEVPSWVSEVVPVVGVDPCGDVEPPDMKEVPPDENEEPPEEKDDPPDPIEDPPGIMVEPPDPRGEAPGRRGCSLESRRTPMALA